EVQPGIEVAIKREETFLDDILGAAGSKGSCALLVLGLLPEKGHGPVEVMELDLTCPLHEIVPAPLIAEAVRAAYHQPVEDGQEKRPLPIETEKPFSKKHLEDF